MWRAVSASIIGVSHELAGAPCQDACDLLRLNTGGEEILLAAMADGAGSAALSHIGASEAVHHLLEVIPRSHLAVGEVSKEQVRAWMLEVLDHLAAVAEREGTSLSQLACTLLLALVSRNGAVFAQIGDGACVVEKDGEILPATWPQNGEYINVTTFITTEHALDTMQFERIEGEIAAVAGFTDGLQMLVLDFRAQSAHAPFFTPMFASVRNCEDEASLIAHLRSFLASEPVTARTDDDKTLVLACWHEPEGGSNRAGQ